MTAKFTYIDLFAGCGGLSLGLHNAGWKGLFAIEKSKDAFETLGFNLIKNKNHFEWPDWLPIKHHNINTILLKYQAELKSLRGKVDLVAGGPPCQGFSSAGRRQESDRRNQLVKSYIQFIKLVRPNVIFFENVKGFTQEFQKNKEKGKNYSSYVEKSLIDAGYTVKGQLVNFGDFGIPQKRTRFILVGVKTSLSRRNKKIAESFFHKIENNREKFLLNRKLTVNTNLSDAISDLLKSGGRARLESFNNFEFGKYSPIKSNYQLLMRGGVSDQVADSHRFANHRDSVVKKFSFFIKNARKNKNLDKAIRKKFKIKKQTIISLAQSEKCPTLTTLPDDHIHYSEPRILTVREYARIQSFPDSFIFRGKYTTGGKVRTKEVPRYTQIGNAIPPLFGEQSGLALKTIIHKGE